MVKCQHSLVQLEGVKTKELKTSVATPMNGSPTIHLQRAQAQKPGSKDPGFLLRLYKAASPCAQRAGMLPPMAKRLGRYLPEQLVLKITLAGSEPKIWRRVEVDSGLTLHELHIVIQCIFNWQNAHLYHFLVPPGGKLTHSAMRQAKRYHVLPADPIFAEDTDDGRADEIMIGRVFTPECKQIVYEYDFGDSWQHVVKIEKRTGGSDPEAPPRCVGGENAAPLDDVGGIYGYYEWLAALRDSAHELHEQAIEWFGEDFDPVRFDLATANRRLKSASTPARPRSRKGKTQN